MRLSFLPLTGGGGSTAGCLPSHPIPSTHTPPFFDASVGCMLVAASAQPPPTFCFYLSSHAHSLGHSILGGCTSRKRDGRVPFFFFPFSLLNGEREEGVGGGVRATVRS